MRSTLEKPFVPAALALGLCFLVGALVFSWAFYGARASQGSLSVTGSAKTDVRADTAKWTVSVYRTAGEGGMAAAYAQVAADAAAVKAYFASQGLSSTTQSTIVADQNYSQYGPTTYNVHEELTVESSDVSKIEHLSQNVTVLLSRGYSISARQPEYYVSNLPQLRVQLLGDAIKDAKARAEAIAKSGGSSVGPLLSASSGVVQVLAPNSTNVEDYGSYDTSTIEKEVSVTARASFSVR